MKPFVIKLSDQQLLVIEQYDHDYELGMRLLPAQKPNDALPDLETAVQGGLLASVRFEERGHFFDVRSYPVILDNKVIKHSEIPDDKSKVLECLMSNQASSDFSNLAFKLEFAAIYALCVRHANQAFPFELDQDMNVLEDWTSRLHYFARTWRSREEHLSGSPFKRFYD